MLKRVVRYTKKRRSEDCNNENRALANVFLQLPPDLFEVILRILKKKKPLRPHFSTWRLQKKMFPKSLLQPPISHNLLAICTQESDIKTFFLVSKQIRAHFRVHFLGHLRFIASDSSIDQLPKDALALRLCAASWETRSKIETFHRLQHLKLDYRQSGFKADSFNLPHSLESLVASHTQQDLRQDFDDRLPSSLQVLRLGAIRSNITKFPPDLHTLQLPLDFSDWALLTPLSSSLTCLDLSYVLKFANSVLEDKQLPFPEDLKELWLPSLSAMPQLPDTLKVLNVAKGQCTDSFSPPPLLIEYYGPAVALNPSLSNNLQVVCFSSNLTPVSHQELPESISIYIDSASQAVDCNFPPNLRVAKCRLNTQIQFPPTLAHLALDGDFDGILEGVPATLQTLHFGPDFSQPLALLPANLVELLFDQPSMFNHPLHGLPPTLRVLRLGRWFNWPLDALPEHLEQLIFAESSIFNEPLNNLPKTLRQLVLGGFYSQPLENLPQSLTELIFCSDSDFCVPLSKLPHNLHLLSLGHKFDHQLDFSQLPKLKKLVLLGAHCADYLDFPESLEFLELGNKFNKPITFPPKLNYLFLGAAFNQPLNDLPASLLVLQLGDGFDQEFSPPPNLARLISNNPHVSFETASQSDSCELRNSSQSNYPPQSVYDFWE